MGLLGLLGLLALTLALSQVLRFQHEEMAELARERALLDPLARSTEVQLGLIGHGAVAELVLRGRTRLEGERLQRQAAVDRSLAALMGELQAGAWQRASREAGLMWTDWRTLAAEVAQRRIDAGQSATRHQLLREQAQQVLDLVQSALPGAERWPATLDPAVLQQRAEALAWRQARLQQRQAQLAQSQAWAALALGLSLALTLLGCWAASRGPAKPPPAPAGQRRQGQGRRQTDHRPTTPAELMAAELRPLQRPSETSAMPLR
jgi:hypothetical protein